MWFWFQRFRGNVEKLDFLISSGEAIDVIQSQAWAEFSNGLTWSLAPGSYDRKVSVPEDEYFVNAKLEDKYYGMQYTKSTNYVMLNKDALDEAGLEVPKFGWTWDDYRDYSKTDQGRRR